MSNNNTLLDSEVVTEKQVGAKAYDMWVNNILTGCDDPEDSMAVIRMAADIIFTNLALDFKNPAGYIYLSTMFYATWHNILEFLASKTKEYSDYKLEITSLLSVGFCNGSDDEESEQGNFVPVIEHHSVKVPMALDNNDSTEVAPTVAWNAKMVTRNPDTIRQIAEKTAEFFRKECDLMIESSEAVFPIFGYIYSSLVTYITLKRREEDKFNYKIDFLNCFIISAMCAEDESTEIGFEPKQMQKLATKHDGSATAPNE